MKVFIRRIIVALAVSAPAQAHAALIFETTSGCPTQEAFTALVERRGGSLEAADSRTFSVTLRRDEPSYVGTLTVDTSEPREIRGATCDEVAEALSITLSLELNAQAEATPPPQAATEPAPLPPPRPTSVPPARSRWGHQVAPVPAGELHVAPQFAVTVSAGASLGLFPLLTTRYDAIFRMASFVTLPNGERSLIGPVLRARLGFVGSPQQSWESSGSSVAVSGQSLGLGMCWSPHYDPAGLVLLGCGELGLAGYSTRVKAPEGATKDSPVTMVGTVGPVLEADYNVGPLHFGARLGGNLVFGTLEAQRADGERLFQSKRWEAFFALGVGGHW